MKLYAHQKKIIDADPKKAGLFLGTGSGKTRTALLLARGEILVICPKTQKEDANWEREYRTIIEDEVKNYKKGNQVRTIKPKLTVMSKEEFRRDASGLPRFTTVIVDEAHTCLGVTPSTRQRARQTIPKASQLFEALASYIERTKPERLYLCTATIIKSPFTVWAAAYLLKPLPFDKMMSSYFDFRQKYYTKLPMPGRDVWAPRKDAKTKDALAEMVRSIGHVGRLEDFFDVPDQTFITKYVELTKEQKDAIKDLHLDYPDPLVRVGKRHQVENGVLSGDEFNESTEFSNGKIDKILELAAEFPRMIIFAKYRAQIAMIQEALTKDGFPTWTLTGDTKDRGEVIKQAGMLDGVLIVQAQISAGWEVPLTPVVVFASMSYSFVDRVQAEGRVQRANNIKKNLYIDLVVKGGIDEAVQEAISNKKDFDERIYLNI